MAAPWARRVLALLGSFAALVFLFFLLVRPWYLQWGATNEETRRTLPGDEIILTATGQETRAITIRAPIERVWPWVTQLGQDRGGFYSYDLLENLVGCEMPTTDRLRPECQSWRIGDKLWMYPRNKAGGMGFATLRTYVPGRALGFGAHAFGTPIAAPEDGSWTFVLEPVGDSATRMLVRGRSAGGRPLLGIAFDRSIFEPVHFVMERRMMIGIQQLAEGSDRGRFVNHLQVGLWVVDFGLILAAVVMVLRRERWGRPLAGFLAAATVFQVLTFLQPSILVGFALVILVAALLWWPGRGQATPELQADVE